MKLLKFGLNFWITITSVVSFLTGWILLAHAQKPVQQSNPSSLVNAAPLPTLEPLAPLSDFNTGSNNSAQQQQSSPFFNFQPRRRPSFGSFFTGGS